MLGPFNSVRYGSHLMKWVLDAIFKVVGYSSNICTTFALVGLSYQANVVAYRVLNVLNLV